MRKAGFLVMLSVVFIMMSAMYVLAAPPTSTSGTTLSGTYNVVGSSVCVRTVYGGVGILPPPLGFDDNYGLLTPAVTRTRHHKGKLVLNKDGTGTYASKQAQITHQEVAFGQMPLNVWEGNCSVSYSTLADGTLQMVFFGCAGRNLAGGGSPGDSGNNQSYSSVLPSPSGDILLLSTTDPYIQWAWNKLDSETDVRWAERICIGNSTAIRVR